MARFLLLSYKLAVLRHFSISPLFCTDHSTSRWHVLLQFHAEWSNFCVKGSVCVHHQWHESATRYSRASKTPGLGENTSDLGPQTQRIKEQCKKESCTCCQLQAAGQKWDSGLGGLQAVGSKGWEIQVGLWVAPTYLCHQGVVGMKVSSNIHVCPSLFSVPSGFNMK